MINGVKSPWDVNGVAVFIQMSTYRNKSNVLLSNGNIISKRFNTSSFTNKKTERGVGAPLPKTLFLSYSFD